MRLYGMRMSGNCWKAAEILRLTGHAFEWVETDGNLGATRTPAFLTINPAGKVPALVMDGGAVLVESNAILLHFAEGTPWLPPPGLARTRVHEWLFFEQYSHEPNIATPRFWATHGVEMTEERRTMLRQKRDLGYGALGLMEDHLSTNGFFVEDRYSIADIALYAYTHVAHEGGFDLEAYPAVRGWIERVASQPGHVAITEGS